jgi:hypothetical protein
VGVEETSFVLCHWSFALGHHSIGPKLNHNERVAACFEVKYK